MGIREEGTIPVVLDVIDFVPVRFLGFTMSELTFTAIACFFLNAAVLAIILAITVGHVLFALPCSIFPTIPLVLFLARRAAILKGGRPSYMMWIDIQFKLQNDGIFGIKILFGFYKTTYWDTCRDK